MRRDVRKPQDDASLYFCTCLGSLSSERRDVKLTPVVQDSEDIHKLHRSVSLFNLLHHLLHHSQSDPNYLTQHPIFSSTVRNPSLHTRSQNGFHRIVSPHHFASNSTNNTRLIACFSDILKIILAVLLPPLGVFLERGCNADFFINILLTILGYIPGIIHALYVQSSSVSAHSTISNTLTGTSFSSTRVGAEMTTLFCDFAIPVSNTAVRRFQPIRFTT